METIRRLGTGDLRGRELHWFLAVKTLVFWGLIASAWVMYPRENGYSILSHTFSFLGSFEEKHSPQWWWLFSVAMVFWGAALLPLSAFHYRRFRAVSRWGAGAAALFSGLAALGLMLVGCFPDARGVVLAGYEWTEIHEIAAVLVAVGFGLAIPCYAVLLLLDRFGRKAFRGNSSWRYRRLLGPYLLWGCAVGLAVYYQVSWGLTYGRMKAEAAATGQTIGSSWAESLNTRYAFPLWENIVIYALFAFLVWFTIALVAEEPEAM